MRAGMGWVIGRYFSIGAAICLCALMVGCRNLRPGATDQPIESHECAASPPPERTREQDRSGPTAESTNRISMRDLALILDTLTRLEQVRPDLKTQMLRELADADAATATALVKSWRARLPELQAEASRIRTASQEIRSPDRGHAMGNQASKLKPTPVPELRPTPPESGSNATVPAPAPPAADAPGSVLPIRTSEESARDECGSPCSASPTWDGLIDLLLNQARERVDETGASEARRHIQVALLDLIRESDRHGSGSAVDAQLWNQLVPALEYCMGCGASETPTTQEVIRSLQVATELLRGPGRFQVRGLTLCTRIRGFGNLDRVDCEAFSPGQNILLYCEVDRFLSELDSDGFRTRISSVLELQDPVGRVFWSQNFGTVEDLSAEPRRDYFLSYRLRLPTNLKAVVYNLRVTLHDELAGRSATNGIALTIR